MAIRSTIRIRKNYPAEHDDQCVRTLKNANISPVYRPFSLPWVSDLIPDLERRPVCRSEFPGWRGLGTYGEPATDQLRQTSKLLEAGVKLDLLHKSLFWGTDVFKQQRTVPSGYSGYAEAHILGFETELNYQPNPYFFATASYSYIQTKLDSPETFYTPAQPGTNVDGSGILCGMATESDFQ